MIEALEDKLIKYGLDYQELPSDLVSNNSGNLLLIKDFKPDYSDKPSASIIVSYYANSDGTNGWQSKCWLPTRNIKQVNGKEGPSNPLSYGEIDYQGIKYCSYSVNLSSLGLKEIDRLCQELYEHIDWKN